MTLVTSNLRSVSRAQQGHENNPIATYATYTGTLSSNRGVEDDGALVNAGDDATYNYWVPSTSGISSATLVSDLGSAQLVNFVGIVNHTLGDAGASLVLAYSTNGSSWTDIDVDHSPTDGQNIGLYFEDITARYWRLSLTFPSSADIQISVVSIGAVLTFPQRTYAGHTPPLQATAVNMTTNNTIGGHFKGTAVINSGKTEKIELAHLSPSFIRGDAFQAFQRRLNFGEPVFWAWRPMKYGDLFYGWKTGGAIAPSNMGITDLMQFGVSLGGFDDTTAG